MREKWLMRMMTKIEISTRVEALLVRTATMLEAEAITTSYSDRLAIELLGDDTTHAYRMLHNLAGESGASALMRRLIGGIIEDARGEVLTPECHYGDMCASLVAMFDPAEVTTEHLLYAVAMDETTLTSQALFGYGITAEDIRREMEREERSTPQITEEPRIDRAGDVEQHLRTLLDALGHKRCVLIVVDDKVAS
jgi:hypothetical protein